MEDEKIIELLWNRDEQGLSELKNKYERNLQSLSQRIVDVEDAMECVNDTYIAVWNSIPPKRPKFLCAYIMKICRNLSYNKLEWYGAAKRNVQIVELSRELEQCIPSADISIEEKELGDLLSKFLRGLPEEKRHIFIRRYWYGDSIHELAESFDYKESKIKSSLFRVRNELREYLRKEGVFL